MKVNYKGHEISISVHGPFLEENGQYSVTSLCVTKCLGSHVEEDPVPDMPNKYYPNKSDAEEAALKVAKKFIDNSIS